MKSRKYQPLIIFLMISFFSFFGHLCSYADEADMVGLTNEPDALILLDLSGSMNADPSGVSNYDSRTGVYGKRYGNSDCSGNIFYNDNTHTGYKTDCRKLAIAKVVINDIMDATNDTSIKSDDKDSLGIRLGYMRFYNCQSGSEEGTKIFAATSDCEPDFGKCKGSTCGRTDGFCNNAIGTGDNYYSATAACTKDAINCAGPTCGLENGFCSSAVGAITYYAANAACTPDTKHCSGAGCGRDDGFCDSAVSGPLYYAAESCTTPNQEYGNCEGADCKNGFCDSSRSPYTYYARNDCSVPDNVLVFGCTKPFVCSGGFCSQPLTPSLLSWNDCSKPCVSKGCTVNCTTPCTNSCTTTGCANLCTNPSCAVDCGKVTAGDSWTTGCNKLIAGINTPYSCIYCNKDGSCDPDAGNGCSLSSSVEAEAAVGGTHLAVALNEAKLYLDAHKATEPVNQRLCRKKYVILISDGDDTFACSGTGYETQKNQYKRRRESIAKAKLLADAGYQVFVIGFGSNMAAWSKNTLNWMAYYGGTDNPKVNNSGSTTGTGAYVIPAGSYYPTGITSCMTSTTSPASLSPCNDKTIGCLAAANDPGDSVHYPLSGYAFMASNTKDLTEALDTAMNLIRESTYSFTQASVQLSRLSSENFLYEASFESRADPFWIGHLKKYPINETDGSIGSMVTNGDAGLNLQKRDGSTRTMYTLIGSDTLTSFSTSIDPSFFGYASSDTTSRDADVGYIKGLSSYNPDSETGVGVYKLGDVFRSSPVAVTTPSPFFYDTRDTCSAFDDFRSKHFREGNSTLDRLVIVGANDGQLHAFKTNDMSEAWSFIPPNLLSKLPNVTHFTDPDTSTHQFFVDGQVTVANAWLGAGTDTCKSKVYDAPNNPSWTTLLVFGEGRGTSPNVWSNSPYCDRYFSPDYKYSATYPYYCGYYAFDLNSNTPRFLWRIKGKSGGAIEADSGNYLGDAWGKMAIGKVLLNGAEKWVGFVGGGYNAAVAGGTDCASNECRGKGFFVIDLKDGKILWNFTLASDANMKYSLPGDPGIADTDNDGFIDRAYIGDLGGNIWRFKFCRKAESAASTCLTTSNWSGSRMFDGASVSPLRPTYVTPTGAWDSLGYFWVYWGTGNKNDPTGIPLAGSPYSDKFFAVKDKTVTDATASYNPYTLSDLKNVTIPAVLYCSSAGSPGCTPEETTNDASKNGFYINFRTDGEKMLSDALIFGGIVYFTTFVPTSDDDATTCSQQGKGYLYGINFMTGAPELIGSDGTMYSSIGIGYGIPSAPIVSMRPDNKPIADLFITSSSVFSKGVLGGDKEDSDRRGGTLVGAECTGENCHNTGNALQPPGLSNKTNILFWKDRRLE